MTPMTGLQRGRHQALWFEPHPSLLALPGQGLDLVRIVSPRSDGGAFEAAGLPGALGLRRRRGKATAAVEASS